MQSNFSFYLTRYSLMLDFYIYITKIFACFLNLVSVYCMASIADILEIILAGLNKEILTVKNITSDKIKIINKSAIICHANG